MEQSLWRAVPHYLRRLSNALKKVNLIYSANLPFILLLFVIFIHHPQHCGKPLPLTCTPIKFGSWMGGDRDGNPNVTAKVIFFVLLFSKIFQKLMKLQCIPVM